MKWLLIPLIILAQRPTKPPKHEGAAKSKSAQIANQADTSQTYQRPPTSTAPTTQSTNVTVAPKEQPSTAAEGRERNETERKAHEEDLRLQRKIVVFTEALVIVGFLQAVVMILQWCVYGRQARIMAHQAGEMTRQRVTMRRQLETMQGQLGAMQDSSKQTDELIRHAGNQAGAMVAVAAAIWAQTQETKTIAHSATVSAEAASKNADALINAERAWVMVDLSIPLDADILHNVDQSDQATTMIQPSIMLSCANKGKSPAWITGRYGRFVIVRPGELPKEPVIAPTDIINDEFEPVAPGEAATSIHWEPLADGRHVILTTRAVFYGVVKYRDIFGNSRETWFGCELKGHRNGRRLERLAGFPEYNRAT